MKNVVEKEKIITGVPGKIIIGNPLYLERTDGYGKCLTADIKIGEPELLKGCAVFSEKEETVEYKDRLVKYSTINVDIIFSRETEKAESLINMYYNGMLHPKELQGCGTLGCDTAGFDFFADDACEHFKTGGDGYYGGWYHYKNDEVIIISLSFDSNFYSVGDLKDKFTYLLS